MRVKLPLTNQMRYYNNYRFLCALISSALIVCGCLMVKYEYLMLIASSVFMFFTHRFRCRYTDSLDFYGELLLKSSIVVWCLANNWYVCATIMFISLVISIDIQFIFVKKNRVPDCIRMSKPEAVAEMLLPSVVICAAGILSYFDMRYYMKLETGILFSIYVVSQIMLISRISK